MNCSMQALGMAAARAKEVAVMIEAARVLTQRAQGQRAHDGTPAAEVQSVYRTIASLALYARQMVEDTERLLRGAPEPAALRHGLPVDDSPDQLQLLLLGAMRDARRAIGMLEDLQEQGVDELRQPSSTAAARDARAEAAALLRRLRGH
jgi:hypothetical protein